MWSVVLREARDFRSASAISNYSNMLKFKANGQQQFEFEYGFNPFVCDIYTTALKLLL